MTNKPTEEELAKVLSGSLPLKDKLMAITRLTGLHLQVDRCFLYVRNPEAGKGRIEFCWCARKDIKDVTQHVWQYDLDLPEQDPLFGAAISLQPSVYVEDVLAAPKEVLNQEFEESTFGHRALIHAHILVDNQLWGILQPAVWNKPRKWSTEDQHFIEALLLELGPLVRQYAIEQEIS